MWEKKIMWIISLSKLKTKKDSGLKPGMFSLRRQILRFVMTLAVLLLLMMVAAMTILISSYQKKVDNAHRENVSFYAAQIESSILQLRETVGYIYSEDSIFQGLYLYQPAADRVNSISNMLNLLKLQVRSNKNLGGLFIYYDSDKKPLYYVNEEMSFRDKEIIKNTGRAIQESSNTFIDYVVKAENDTYYNVYMQKNSAAISGNVSLSQGIPEVSGEEEYGIIYEGSFYHISGREAELSDREVILLKPGRIRLNGTVAYVRKLNSTNMSVVKIIPQSIWLYLGGIHIVLLLLGLLLILFCIRLYRFTSDQLSVPLEDMTNALRNIQEGVWEVDFTATNRITEIENVRQTVRMMLKEIEQYKIRSYEEQLEKQKVQLQFLQLQLAPHFYTNCLKNAYYMLMMKEYENAEDFLLCLSAHLRYLLQTDTTVVTVQTEREFVDNYITMQEILSSRPFICEISVDEKARELQIPILTLQMFVENSIKYARGSEERNLQIQIHVRYLTTENGNRLDIIIYDNGPGYPKEILSVLNQKAVPKADTMGIGISNLLGRMHLHYGEEISWYFDNRDGAYSEIILPAEKGE